MSDELTVANRNESWLKGIADGDTDSLEPMTHKELWYKAIADGEVPDFLHPVTHEELWLQKIAESGGGGSNWELLASDEFTVDTTSTSESSVGNVSLTDALDLDKYSKNDIIVVHLRDKSGKRVGYFYGSDSFFLNEQLANNVSGGMQFPAISAISYNTDGQYVLTNDKVGVYCKSIYWGTTTKRAAIYSKYNSSRGTIDGTYKVDVYKLTLPEGMTLFD